jgi:menaquinone-9 beta-reductase
VVEGSDTPAPPGPPRSGAPRKRAGSTRPTAGGRAGAAGPSRTGPRPAGRDGADTAGEGHVHDVLVIGAGPGGSSCAYWLADAGWDVVVIEKKRFPREKTCGDGLTPRAVRQLADMGLEHALTGSQRHIGLRAHGFGQVLEMAWPEHPAFPSYGYNITRHDLDTLVAEGAVKAGATVWQGTEAVRPLLEPGAKPAGPSADDVLPICLGAVARDRETGRTREIRARYVVVADGSNSRFGRALGTARQRQHPMGMALRGYYRSPRHDDPYIESHLDIRDADGNVVPGYGWIFPLGDGRVNVGVGLLATDKRWKGVNTTKLMDAFVEWAPQSWELSPASCCGPPTGGKLPMGLAVGPHAGPNTVVVGDAAGSINPFNGEGIAYGYETGRLAAAFIGEALAGGGPAAVLAYEQRLAEVYGSYYRVARAFVRLVSNPQVMRACVGGGLRSELLMNQLLRIMANLMRPDVLGPAEVGFRAMEAVAHLLVDGPGGGTRPSGVGPAPGWSGTA